MISSQLQELNALSWPDNFFQCQPAMRYPRVEALLGQRGNSLCFFLVLFDNFSDMDHRSDCFFNFQFCSMLFGVFWCFLLVFCPVQIPCFHDMHQDTPLVMVRSESDLKEMIQEIKSTCIGKEIAVDVEHHDFRWDWLWR